MTDRSFLDTNILLYADDNSAGPKQQKAILLIESAIRERKGILSTQVMQEYFVNATRKLGIAPEVARATLSLYQRLTTVVIRPEDVLAAIDIHRLHSVSLWDSLIIHAAQQSGCKTLYSEDLQNGQKFGAVTVVNPFLP